MLSRGGTIRLQIYSNFEMVDFVQVISDRVGQLAGMDEDTVHWIGVAVRESVINAIKHGNQSDTAKHVFVDFATIARDQGRELMIRVRDEGEGFDPETIANPLDPENVLKGSSRGLFLVRSFMDDVRLQRAPEGGMEVRMTKRVQPAAEAEDPVRR